MLALPDHIVHSSASDLVVIGGSAGGIHAMISLLKALPASFDLPILAVQHLSGEFPSVLPDVLQLHTKRRVKWAEQHEPIRPGTLYVGPPDRHLMVGRHRQVILSSAPRVGWWRPAVDVLFESAAEVYGDRVAAVVLSGSMWDGAKGIAAVASRGGITIAQDEATSGHFDMPASAIDFGRDDLVMNPMRIAQALEALAHRSC